MNTMMIRTAHRRIAVVALPLLAVSAITGVVYRVGRNWFGMSNETGSTVRSIHAGGYLGDALSPFYVLLMGLCLLMLIAGGVMMWRRSDVPLLRGDSSVPRKTFRWFHRVASMVLVLPLALTALTGMGYGLAMAWLGWPKERAQWLMDLHQGTLFFGKDHRVYYALFVGVGLLLLLGSGTPLMRLFRGGPAGGAGKAQRSQASRQA
jgi:hypothetical protein